MKRNATLVLALLVLSAFGGGMIWLGSHSLVRGQTPATQQGKSAGLGYRRLGIEVGLSKPFNVPGATKGHILQTFLRVPNGTDGGTGTAFSAIRVAPKIVGDKITVNVSLVSGDTSLVKNCKDWDQLKESPLASYTLSEGEEVSVSQLSNLGANFNNGKLTFKAVVLTVPYEESGCGCATCNQLVCCPNSGACLGCGTCGDVCCKGSSE